LIDCDISFSANIIEELKKIPEIAEFYRVQSIYDMIAKVNADSEDQLHGIIMRKIRENRRIMNSLTMIIISIQKTKKINGQRMRASNSYYNLIIITWR
jgi:DNA-binding Lrp family transcriptional regulator